MNHQTLASDSQASILQTGMFVSAGIYASLAKYWPNAKRIYSLHNCKAAIDVRLHTNNE